MYMHTDLITFDLIYIEIKNSTFSCLEWRAATPVRKEGKDGEKITLTLSRGDLAGAKRRGGEKD